MPSLHFGWSMLLGAVIIWIGRNSAVWAVGLLWPFAMFFAIVMTGNHFILDAVAGAVVSVIGFWMALFLDRRWPRIFTRIGGWPTNTLVDERKAS
jgi:membrane-associated phospholipid phosphatase